MSRAEELARFLDGNAMSKTDYEAADELRRLSAVEAELTALKKAIVDAEPVAAQHRFRRPEKTAPNWSAWQPCHVTHSPEWRIDDQGYEVEYRNLYTLKGIK